MPHPDLVTVAAFFLPRAEEAWEAPLLGGLIPILGLGGVLWLIWYAVKEPPKDDDEEDPPEAKKEGEPEDPPSR